MKIYAIIAFLVLFSCSKNNVDESQKVTYSNEIVKISIDKKEYVAARNSKLIIVPIIQRETEQSDRGLQFIWSIDDVIVSRERNLNYIIPNSYDLGVRKCLYKVIDINGNNELSVEFTLSIVFPFGYGYYFLSEDENKNSQIAHINITKNSDIVFNTSVIDDIALGDTPKILSKEIIYKPSSNSYFELNIITSKGKYPYIKTNTNTFTVDDKIDYNGYGLEFEPSFHLISQRGIDMFINGGQILIYDNGNIFISNSNNIYNWSDLIESKSGKHVYSFDKISKKCYIIIPDKSGYVYEDVIPIVNCPLMREEEIVGYHSKFVRLSQNSFKEEVSLLTATIGKLIRYKIEYDGNSASINIIKSEVINGVNLTTSAIATNNGMFYIGIGNTIHSLASVTDDLKPFIKLPTTGDIVKIIISDDNSKLIVTMYDKSSTQQMKGSIHIIDIKSSEIISYPNTITRCVSIVDCPKYEAH